MTASSKPSHTNRLAAETSPYLLQHAHNPVDWYAWGPEAFDAARKLNKPIFLSVGYSTCYWCHVMERQCFENEEIAAEMNQRFINIKVDREERPDVDQLYMQAVQIMTRHGGWPMSVFLTQDLRPFYGGTYFPPEDMHGRPGFPTILRASETAFRDRPKDVERSASQLVRALAQMAEPPAPDSPLTIDNDMIERWLERSVADYEPQFGGFGSAPKFPRETLLELILVSQESHPSERRMKTLRHALDAMAAGGIRDHLGGGFHRYSTDAQWLVPHFEIMLYDNAMLAWIYAEAYQQTRDENYANIARGICDFILREMTSPDGAFYTAFDAEVDAMEGLSYLWTAEEVTALLGDENASIFNRVYGLDRGPNFSDPHHGTGQPDKNILYLPQPLPKVAAEFKLSVAELESRLRHMREKLYAARAKRKQPLLDTKIITSWNALMIRALAHAGQILNESRYLNSAAHAADYLLREHKTSDDSLYRTSRDGVKKYLGFLDDYAFLLQALLALQPADSTAKYSNEASALLIKMRDLFEDQQRGGFYFTSAAARDLIVRQKVASDSPLPSGNAVAAMVLIELGVPEATEQVLAVFAEQLNSYAEGMSSLVQAAMLLVHATGPLNIKPAKSQPDPSHQSLPDQFVIIETAWRTPTELDIVLKIASGFHLNSHEPAEGLVGTRLMIGDEFADDVAGVEYPRAQEIAFPSSPSPIPVYAGESRLVLRFKQPLSHGRAIKLALTYQACDDSACHAPVTRHFEAFAP